MTGSRALQTTIFAALVIAAAAGVAALIAHVGIDVAGDVVLTHDAYDGLDHHSRSDVCLLAVVLALAALTRVVWSALHEAHTGCATVGPDFEAVFGRSPWRFVAAVVALTLPLLMGMELLDTVADGSRFHDAADLVGGSVTLGLSITVPVAALVAAVVRCIARLIANSHRALVAVLGQLIMLLAFASVKGAAPLVARAGAFGRRQRSILARRAGKRAPPLPAS